MDRIRLGILQVNHDKSDTIGDHFPMMRTASVICSTSRISAFAIGFT